MYKKIIVLGLASLGLLFAFSSQAEFSGPEVGADDFVAGEVGEVRSTVERPKFHREKGLTGEHTYIVTLNEPAVPAYTGGIGGFAATNPSYVQNASAARNNSPSAGRLRLDPTNADVVAYSAYLSARQSQVLNEVRFTLGRSVSTLHDYVYALNGFSATMTQDEAASVAALANVAQVVRSQEHPLLTDAGPRFIGADTIWDGTGIPDGIPGVGLDGTFGEGIVVGILDSGINGDHPSFAGVGADGYAPVNPLGDGNYLGLCSGVTPQEVCNNKLIGRYNTTNASGGSEDIDGHGSHTASTTAGNFVDAPLYDAGGNPIPNYELGISGVAPHANIIAFRVCPANTCPTDAVIAAVDQAIATGIVDVLNHSIGAAAGNPWGEVKSQAFRRAWDAGIAVANSAGNSGVEIVGGNPAGTVNLGSATGAGSAPWTMSVAASSHDRAFPEVTLSDMAGGDTTPPATVFGRAINGESVTAPIVYAGDYDNGDADPAQCLIPFPPQTFDGQIVLCDRGAIARVEKGSNVAAGGAGGYVLANLQGGASFLADDANVIPSVHVSADDGDAIKAWLATGTGHVATISASGQPISDPNVGDIRADFSSQGPYFSNAAAQVGSGDTISADTELYDFMIPNITAPGLSIYAAYADPIDYSFLQGTSMSSPHIAGAMALLMAAQPTWSVPEVFSAIQTTAVSTGLRRPADVSFPPPVEDATPFDHGAGRVNLAMAAKAGLLLDESAADMDAANPALSGDIRALNLPGLQNSVCFSECSWTRSLKATVDGTWTASSEGDGLLFTVEPSNFSLAAGDIQEVTVTANVDGLAINGFGFGKVVFTPDDADVAATALTVVTRSTPGALPDALVFEANRDSGSELFDGLVTRASDELVAETVFGLSPVSFDEISVNVTGENPEFDPFAPNAAISIIPFELPDGANALSASTLLGEIDPDADRASVDMDLFFVHDVNGDGSLTAGVDEILCESGTETSVEACTVDNVPAGLTWVVVLAFADGSAATDATNEVIVSTELTAAAAVAGFSAETPGSLAQAGEWNLRVYWDDVLDEGTMYRAAINIVGDGVVFGTVPVEITRGPDDVKTEVVEPVDVVVAGDELPLRIEVIGNGSLEDRNYAVTADVPHGLELVEGSVEAPGDSSATVVDGDFLWELTQQSLSITGGTNYTYRINGPNVDPSHPYYSADCDSGVQGLEDYIRVADLGIDPAELEGDNISFSTFAEQNITFFGEVSSSGMTFTDNGYGVMMGMSLGNNPGTTNGIPSTVAPNGLMAALWSDTEIVLDASNGRGAYAATGGDNLSVIEWAGMERAPAGSSTDRISFEIVLQGFQSDSPGTYEVAFGYNDIVGDWSDATIGLEDTSGTVGVSAEIELSDGLFICFDIQEASAFTQALSYRVRATEEAAGQTVSHTVLNTVDIAGTVQEEQTVTVAVEDMDSDGDGIMNSQDNCMFWPNPDQEDTNGDGYGNDCDADFNNDGLLDEADLDIMREYFFTVCSDPDSYNPDVDLTLDGVVNVVDLARMRFHWDQTGSRRIGPSGPLFGTLSQGTMDAAGSLDMKDFDNAAVEDIALVGSNSIYCPFTDGSTSPDKLARNDENRVGGFGNMPVGYSDTIGDGIEGLEGYASAVSNSPGAGGAGSGGGGAFGPWMIMVLLGGAFLRIRRRQ